MAERKKKKITDAYREAHRASLERARAAKAVPEGVEAVQLQIQLPSDLMKIFRAMNARDRGLIVLGALQKELGDR